MAEREIMRLRLTLRLRFHGNSDSRETGSAVEF